LNDFLVLEGNFLKKVSLKLPSKTFDGAKILFARRMDQKCTRKACFSRFLGANTHISPQNDSFAAFKVFGIQPFFQKGLAGQGQSPWAIK
jgi:hypothetical protein